MAGGKDLKLLIESRHPLVAVETDEEDRLAEILQRIAAQLGLAYFTWTPVDGLRRAGGAAAIPLDRRTPLEALERVATLPGEAIYFFKDLHKFLENAAVVRRLRDLAPALAKSRRTLVLAAPQLELPADLRATAALIRLELPSVEELDALVLRVASVMASRTSGCERLMPPDRRRIAESLRGLTLFDAERALTRVLAEDSCLTTQSTAKLLSAKKQVIERDGLLDFRPNVEDFTAIGGLANLKAWLGRRKNAFTAEAKAFGLEAPKGILVLGVQGCGKSLAAKAVAKEWELPLLKLEPGRLYDKFVGESEKNLERALDVASRLAPVVLWIDELEKGFAAVGQSETDAGLSKRIFGRLLSWLQDRPAPVFVTATCNDISSLPPELMRKGRFDEIFFVDLPTDAERREILAIHLKKRRRDPAGFDLALLAAVTEGFSGAEIEQAIVSGLYSAFAAGRDLTTDLLVAEAGSTRPLSVVRAEEVSRLRDWASTRTVSAS